MQHLIKLIGNTKQLLSPKQNMQHEQNTTVNGKTETQQFTIIQTTTSI